MPRLLSRYALLLLLPVATTVAAQEQEQEQEQEPKPERVLQTEDVRLDYAQVLNVEPVYQTLRATRTEQECDVVEVRAAPVRAPGEQSRWARLVESVKRVFSSEEASPASAEPAEPAHINCRMVPVEREFRRPIAYDVDYVYKGTKYRSRLAEDPGNRLRIRVSVMPYVPSAPIAPPAVPPVDTP